MSTEAGAHARRRSRRRVRGPVVRRSLAGAGGGRRRVPAAAARGRGGRPVTRVSGRRRHRHHPGQGGRDRPRPPGARRARGGDPVAPPRGQRRGRPGRARRRDRRSGRRRRPRGGRARAGRRHVRHGRDGRAARRPRRPAGAGAGLARPARRLRRRSRPVWASRSTVAPPGARSTPCPACRSCSGCAGTYPRRAAPCGSCRCRSGRCTRSAATRSTSCHWSAGPDCSTSRGRRPWDDALAMLDAGPAFLGEIVGAGQPVGRAGGSAPAELRGAVLTVAGHDHQAAAFALGAARRRRAASTRSGTAEALAAHGPGAVDAGAIERMARRDIRPAGEWCRTTCACSPALPTGISLERVGAMVGAPTPVGPHRPRPAGTVGRPVGDAMRVSAELRRPDGARRRRRSRPGAGVGGGGRGRQRRR